jgi:hypothetical protein
LLLLILIRQPTNRWGALSLALFAMGGMYAATLPKLLLLPFCYPRRFKSRTTRLNAQRE